MANAIKWSTPAERTTGIAAGPLAAGANLLSDEIDNGTNRDQLMDLELTWTCATASGENEAVEVYLLEAVDGTNYEDGGTSVDPKKMLVSTFVDDGGTAAQKQTISRIPISPFKFKILLKSELAENAAAVTLLAYTYDDEIQ